MKMLALILSQIKFYKRLFKTVDERKLLAYHLKQVGFEKPKKIRIVFCCNGVVIHGGLVDRLKGIITMYDAALQLDAEFYISFTDPFSLSNYLVPNKVSWNKKDIQFNPLRDRIIYKIFRKKQEPINAVEWFDKTIPRTYFVYSNLDQLVGAHPDMSGEQIRGLWRTYFFQLFAYSKILQAGLDVLPKEQRIVCHTRFVGMLGDFNDTEDKRLKEEEIPDLFALLDARLSHLIALHPGLPLYLLSDSPRYLKHVAEKGICKVLPGTPKHIDIKIEETAAEDHLKTFTDFVFIAESEAVYSLNLPPMHSSMFCAMAAIIGNKKVQRISA